MKKQILSLLTSLILVFASITQGFSQQTDNPKVLMEFTAMEGYLIIPGKSKELIYSVSRVGDKTPINKMIVIDNGRSVSYSVSNGADQFSIALGKGIISCDSVPAVEETEFKVVKTECFKCKTISSFFPNEIGNYLSINYLSPLKSEDDREWVSFSYYFHDREKKDSYRVLRFYGTLKPTEK